jgi:hypothetical protein
MNLVLQRWVSSPQCRAQWIHSLSEKSRNRKWELPNPTNHLNPPLKNPSSSTSITAKPTQQQPVKHARLENSKALGNTRHLSAVRKSSSNHEPSDGRIQQTKLGGSTPFSNPLSQVTVEGRRPRVSKADLEPWLARKLALKEKFQEGWRPGRRISPEAMEGIRILKKQVPQCVWISINLQEATFHCYGTGRVFQDIARGHSPDFKKSMAPLT